MPTNADAFRALMEGKITTEQYLRTLEERAKELRDPAPVDSTSAGEPVSA